MESFVNIMSQLEDLYEQYFAGKIKPWPHSQERDSLIRSALAALARESGSDEIEISALNVHGEVMVKALHQDRHTGFCGKFRGFAQFLNKCEPRCGEIQYGRNAVMHEESGYCYIIMVAVERMLLDHYRSLKATA